MKKVALCCPAIHETIDVTYGLRKLAAYAYSHDARLAGEVEIDIVPLEVTEEQERAADILLAAEPELVGLSAFIWNIKDILGVARRIKERSPKTRVVFGGPQVSDPQWDILRHTDVVDLVVRGEGEATFAEVLRLWVDSGRLAAPEVAGISYRDGRGESVHNPDRPVISPLDEIPHIYRDVEVDPKVLYGLETTRGCYLRCGFCSMGLSTFRKHSAEYALEEVEAMAAAGVERLNVLDSSFTFHPRRNIPIARRMGELGMRYICCGKAEEMSSELIDVLLDTGMIKIEFGLQAIKAETLRMMGRRMNQERYAAKVRELLDKARCTDVEVTLDVIAGLPGDDFESFKETLDFAYSLRPHGVSCFPLQLLPATEFFQRAEEFGIEHTSVYRPIFQEHGRYNLHRHGLVTSTRSFTPDTVEAARRICMLNALVLQAHLTDLVYRILDLEGLRYTTWLERIAAYFQPGIYRQLEEMTSDLEARKRVWLELRRVMADYADHASPAVYRAITERFPEAARTA